MKNDFSHFGKKQVLEIETVLGKVLFHVALGNRDSRLQGLVLAVYFENDFLPLVYKDADHYLWVD